MKAAQAFVAGEKKVWVWDLPQSFFVSAFRWGKVDLSILRFMISSHLSVTSIFWEKSPWTTFVAFPFLKAICQCFKFFPACLPWGECSGWPLVSGLINFQFYVRRQPGVGGAIDTNGQLMVALLCTGRWYRHVSRQLMEPRPRNQLKPSPGSAAVKASVTLLPHALHEKVLKSGADRDERKSRTASDLAHCK